jgi:hypothetical protein
MPDTAVPTNGASTVHDLFALSDEQILEIEAEPQDIEIADVYLDDEDRAVLVAPASLPAGLHRARGEENRRLETGTTDRADRSDVGAQHAAPERGKASTASHDGENTAAASSATASHQSPAASHDPAAPPQWLADRMSDPQAGVEARALWDSVQQSRAEAAGFREIFAKPEEARAAAQRARLLDDIDRAYFAGDATQRASLAASMMREDPAAFREMVFAGLRALEEGAQASPASGDASPLAHSATPGGATGNSGSSPSPNSRASDVLATPQHGSLTSHAALARPNQAVRDSTASRAVAHSQPAEAADASAASDSSTHRIASDSARDARQTPRNPSREEARTTESATADHVAANYAAFERSTNDDLERIVGGSIDRTLDRALPHGNRADSAAMRTRLAAGIRQDIERSLQGDRQLGEQVSQILSARRLDEATRSQVVRLIGERAQQLISPTTRRVLGEWTQTTLAAHRERAGRADTAISRRDVEPTNSAAPSARPAAASSNAASATRSPAASQRGTSTGRPAPSAAPKSNKLDYRRVSDEQILDL